MRIGWLGGTFDPIHLGHLDVARAARDVLALSRVILVPANVPPHRQPPEASTAHRFAMAALATLDEDLMAVSDLETRSDDPSYTTATLDRLAARGVDTRNLYFVIGADAFREIATWKDYPRLLDRCHFAVISRPGLPAPRLREALPDLVPRMVEPPFVPGADPRIVLIDALTAPVSSTVVRQRAATGGRIDDLVPARVARHIRKHRLYRTDAGTGAAELWETRS